MPSTLARRSRATLRSFSPGETAASCRERFCDGRASVWRALTAKAIPAQIIHQAKRQRGSPSPRTRRFPSPLAPCLAAASDRSGNPVRRQATARCTRSREHRLEGKSSGGISVSFGGRLRQRASERDRSSVPDDIADVSHVLGRMSNWSPCCRGDLRQNARLRAEPEPVNCRSGGTRRPGDHAPQAQNPFPEAAGPRRGGLPPSRDSRDRARVQRNQRGSRNHNRIGTVANETAVETTIMPATSSGFLLKRCANR